jgi:hypothetical protein
VDATRDLAEVPERKALKLSLTPKPPRLNPRWLPIAEWLALTGLVVTFAGGSFWPAWRALKSDFPNYYLAAELYHRGIPLDRVYEWTWFQRQNNHLGVSVGLVGFAPNPPMSILSLVPFTTLQPLAAKRAWLVCNLVFLAFSLWALHQVTLLNWRRLGLISLLCVLPLHIEFLYARHYVLILALICGAYYAFCSDRQRTCGVLLAVATVIKLFPALFAILFVWKRNWRALSALVLGTAAITAVSLLMFGVEVHRVFLNEVLSQASRCDWLGPYVLAQNSFITLWSHLFLLDPELNPFPLYNSPTLYAVAQAITVTVLVFSFLLSVKGDKTPSRTAFHWAALVPLLLLLSTTTGADHPCLLIFTGIVGFNALLATSSKGNALVLLLLYAVACARVPHQIANWFPLYRLASMTALYALLLYASREDHRLRLGSRWLAAGLISVAVLTFYNLRIVRNRAEDFGRRLPSSADGNRAANPVPVAGGVVFTEMQRTGYEAVFLTNGGVRGIALSGDVLSVAGAGTSPQLYSELAGRQSLLVRVPTEGLGTAPETLAEGQEPSLSPDGKWLAFIREEHGSSTAWLSATDSKEAPQMILPSTYHALDLSATPGGDVIAAVGKVSDPHLVLVRRVTRDVMALAGFPHPARYPSISPDGKRVAFSRLDHGSWHVMVREFASGQEQQLTHAWCNSISPSWQDGQTLLYASDCGRGVGLGAIVRRILP